MCNKRIEPTYLHRIEQKEKEEERHVSWMEQEVGGGFLVFFPTHTLSCFHLMGAAAPKQQQQQWR